MDMLPERREIMAAFVRRLLLGAPNGPSFGTVTVNVDLGTSNTPFVAWGAITWIDPRSSITGNDFIGLDIQSIDGMETGSILNLGGGNVLRVGAVARSSGRNILFRLRSIPFTGGGNLVCGAEVVVITNP
jgi:hypothetical protein